MNRLIHEIFNVVLICSLSLPGIVIFIEPSASYNLQSYVDWPMFRCDPTHTGFSLAYAPVERETTFLLWSNTTGGAIKFSSSAIYDGRLLIGSEDGYLYAFNSTSGCQIWKRFLGGPIQSSPAISNDTVFAGSLDGKIYARNVTDGEELWSENIGDQVWSSPTVAQDKVYIASFNRTVYALNVTTGSPVWRNYTDMPSKSSFALKDGKAFIGALDHKVYAFNMENGNLEWESIYLGGDIKESSPAVSGGKVFVGSTNNVLYALNESDGEICWEGETQGSIRSSPAVAYGRVFVGSKDNRTYAFNESTGVQLWSFETGGYVYSSPAAANGAIFVGSCDGVIYALNATTGEELWSYSTGDEILSSPAIAYDRVFIGSKDWKVYALGRNTPPVACFEFEPQEPEIDEEVTFNGSSSYDADPMDSIAKFEWDFGDGNITETTASTVTHKYEEGGVFNVTLIVTDEYNFTSLPCSGSIKVRRHMVNIIDVSPESVTVEKDDILNVTVTVTNEGDYNESVTVSVWCANQTGRFNMSDLESAHLEIDETKILMFSWNTTHFSRGTYHVSATVDGKEKDDGNVTIVVHDLAVSSLSANMTSVPRNETILISVSVVNLGAFLETDLVATVYANSTLIGENSTGALSPSSSWNSEFEWSTEGFAYGDYTVSGNVTVVVKDVNLTNNDLSMDLPINIRPPIRDVAVEQVSPSAYSVIQGEPQNITVAVRNKGEHQSERVTVAAWCSNETSTISVGSADIDLGRNTVENVTLAWNTTLLSGGRYLIGAHANITEVDDYPDDNDMSDGEVLIIAPIKDVWIAEVEPRKTIAFHGFEMPIKIVIENIGNETTDPFEAHFHCNDTYLTHQVPSLVPGQQEVWEEEWTPYNIGHYIMEVTAEIIDDNLLNNNRTATIDVVAPVPDIAVTKVETVPEVLMVARGRPVTINVEVENQGAFEAAFSLRTYVNMTSNGNVTLVGTTNLLLDYLDPPTIIALTWNTSEFMPAFYEIVANVTILDGEEDLLDNSCVDGQVEVKPGVHDVAINGVPWPSPGDKSVFCRSFHANISVVLENEGTFTEDVNVSICLIDMQYKETQTIGSRTVSGLLPEETRRVIIVICVSNSSNIENGMYKLKACTVLLNAADLIPSNNNASTPLWSFYISKIGDITGSPEGYPDGKVDIKDVANCAIRYGCIYLEPLPPSCWHSNCDINNNGKIDIFDIAIIAKHYGQ